jgi:CHAD domain-containing protein
MASYRFEPGSALDVQARRLIRRQLKSASRALSEGVTAQSIHRARRCLKRCRSLVVLVQPSGGRRSWSAEAAALKEASNRLAGARDVQAKLDALAKLEAWAADQSLTPTFARLRKGIDSRRKSREQDIGNSVAGAIAADLGGLAVHFTRKRLRGFGEAAMMNGVAETYRRGRKAMARAYRKNRDEDFHEWRKQMQRHWRHMQLLESVWPEEIAARTKAAQDLSALLGDDHDLWMLLGYLNEGKLPLAQNKRQRIAELGRDLQSELRRRARWIGAQLYAEKPRPFVRRLTVYWSVAAEAGPAVPVVLPIAVDVAPPAGEVPAAAESTALT